MAHKVVYNACYGGFGLSTEAEHWLIKHGVTVDQIEDFSFGNDRHNTKLVECVETLGDECNGFSACLSVTEIEGNIYRIEGYDGFETVVEPNEDWITIED